MTDENVEIDLRSDVFADELHDEALDRDTTAIFGCTYTFCKRDAPPSKLQG